MVREMENADLTGLLTLYMQLHNNPFPTETERVTQLWEEISADKNHHIIVAEQDGEIVSSCVVIIVPNLTHNLRPYAFVENVITDQTHRRQGLAAGCLNFAKEIAKREHCYKLMLMTGSKEAGTLRFYERAGYNKEDKSGFIQWLD